MRNRRNASATKNSRSSPGSGSPGETPGLSVRTSLRSWMAVMFIILGAIIVVRGIVEAAPLTFTLMGVLMIVLGIYRLRAVRGGRARRG